MKRTGIIIIIIGLILTIFTAFTFFTKEKVVDIGEVHITRNIPHNLKWSPMIGVAVMGIGGVLILFDSKQGKIK
jgi:regulatory protein YycI of two-component signal transduction system YycFG